MYMRCVAVCGIAVIMDTQCAVVFDIAVIMDMRCVALFGIAVSNYGHAVCRRIS
jgi:hypothetical protein